MLRENRHDIRSRQAELLLKVHLSMFCRSVKSSHRGKFNNADDGGHVTT